MDTIQLGPDDILEIGSGRYMNRITGLSGIQCGLNGFIITGYMQGRTHKR